MGERVGGVGVKGGREKGGEIIRANGGMRRRKKPLGAGVVADAVPPLVALV